MPEGVQEEQILDISQLKDFVESSECKLKGTWAAISRQARRKLALTAGTRACAKSTNPAKFSTHREAGKT
jgi:hypothetical protein